MKKTGAIEILGMNVSMLTYESFLEFIIDAVSEKKKAVIGYANVDTLNKAYTDHDLKKIYESFDLIHADGIGVYLASRYTDKKKSLPERMTGSDFYPMIVNESLKRDYRWFFLGHSDEMLLSVKSRNPGLKIAGVNEGYHFKDEEVIEKINEAKPDILIIGLSCPRQEKWIFENKDKIDFNVALLVGDGIKVFAGKKVRGPLIMRKLGMEWVIRFLSNPVQNFNKYITGIPLFITRIIKNKR